MPLAQAFAQGCCRLGPILSGIPALRVCIPDGRSGRDTASLWGGDLKEMKAVQADVPRANCFRTV